ncbi:S9 family peptidase [Maribacter algicola]|uniref:S9 family peptidase n=1 Tax=Meishania litoralis TaxID=3434685 RepID=A0ACC7LGL1_9FLAO
MSYYIRLILLILIAALFACDNGNHGVAGVKVLDTLLKQYPIYVKISPKGDAILLKERSFETFDLFISNLDNSSPIKIDSSDFTQLSLTWHPSGGEIIFQELNPKTRKYDLCILNIETKEKSKINLPSSSNAIPPIRWSVNGKYLAYVSTNELSRLYIFDFEEKKVVRVFADIDSYSDFRWLDNTTIFFLSHPKNPTLYKFNVPNNHISKYSLNNYDEVKNFSVKENKLLFVGREKNEEYFQCFELKMDERLVEKLTDSDFNIEKCKYSKNTSSFYYNRNENGVSRLYSSDWKVDSLIQNETDKLSSFELELELNSDLYLKQSTSGLPPSLLKVNVSNGKKKTLYLKDNISFLKLGNPELVRISGSTNEDEIPGYLWKAKPQKKAGVKTIIYVHGGPYLQFRPLWNMHAKLFTKYGFNFLAINYHGSSGYSKQFAMKNNESKQILDVVNSVLYLKEKYGLNSKDIILIGSSYGGKLVMGAIDYLEGLGGVVLISGLINQNIKNTDRLRKLRMLVFYGEYDPLALITKELLERKNLIDLGSDNLEIFKGEGHFFHKTTSWTHIYTKIIEL